MNSSSWAFGQIECSSLKYSHADIILCMRVLKYFLYLVFESSWLGQIFLFEFYKLAKHTTICFSTYTHSMFCFGEDSWCILLLVRCLQNQGWVSFFLCVCITIITVVESLGYQLCACFVFSWKKKDWNTVVSPSPTTSV